MSGVPQIDNDVVSIKNVLDTFLKNSGLYRSVKARVALTVWADAVGYEIACNTRAVNIRNGIMMVAVRNHIWANQLLFLKTKIIDKINSRIGNNIVSDLRFFVRTEISDDDSNSESGVAIGCKDHQMDKIMAVNLNEEDHEIIASICNEFEDDILKCAIKRTLSFGIRFSRFKKQAQKDFQ